MTKGAGDGPVGRTTGYGYSEFHGRHHAGIDIGTSGQKGFFVAFGMTGTVSSCKQFARIWKNSYNQLW